MHNLVTSPDNKGEGETMKHMGFFLLIFLIQGCSAPEITPFERDVKFWESLSDDYCYLPEWRQTSEHGYTKFWLKHEPCPELIEWVL